ncbi:DUF6443 domain-containing protein, partial [Dysgonomonas sp.]
MKTRYIVIHLLSVLVIANLHSQTAVQNYIQTRTYTNAAGTAYQDQIQYFDGLGRPMQTVQRGITPDGKDL